MAQGHFVFEFGIPQNGTKGVSMRKKVEYAALWAATVALGAIIINMQNGEQIDWLSAIVIGLAVGAVNLVWAVVREKLRRRKR